MTAFRKAMVLAAGRGVRLKPLTDTCPKPLVPVLGVPLIDRALDWLAASGIEEAVVNTHYKADMLEAHLAGRQRPAIRISREEALLETGGGIKKALPLLGKEAFFVANSDAICLEGKTPVLRRLEAAWDEARFDVLLLLHPVAKAVGYHEAGDFFIDNGVLRRRTKEEKAPFVFTGIQLLHPRIFTGAPEGAFSLNVLYNRALQEGARAGALVHDGDWLHVGDMAGLAAAETFLRR